MGVSTITIAAVNNGFNDESNSMMLGFVELVLFDLVDDPTQSE